MPTTDSTTDEPVSRPEYMQGVSDVYKEMADTILVVEGVELPVHRDLLAANSDVFASLLISSLPDKSNRARLRIPLVDDTLSEILTVLGYLYRHRKFIIGQGPVQPNSPDDVRALVKFAHKYNMEELVKGCEAYLIDEVQKTSHQEYVLFKRNELVVAWTELAEQCGLKRFLAYCERFMIQDHDESFWHDPAVKADRLSHDCLLRVLHGQQAHRQKAWAYIRTLPLTRKGSKDFDVDIKTLMEWQALEDISSRMALLPPCRWVCMYSTVAKHICSEHS